MPISFECPHCGAVSEQYPGRVGSCDECGGSFLVPLSSAKPAQFLGGCSSLVFWGLVLFCGGLILFAIFPPVGSSGPSRRASCSNHMHQLAIAMLNYREQYGTFPPAYSTDKNGKPLHSWRVLLLPMLEEDELCTKIDFQQPWNSPKNRALADQMPEIFRCPSSTAGEDDACTSYVMIVGPSTISDGPTARTMDEITDGTSRTLLLVEVRDSGVNWMEPKDLDAQAISFKINDGKGRSISSPHEGGANVSMCDASVHFLRDTTDPKQVKAMTTIAGGEEVDLP